MAAEASNKDNKGQKEGGKLGNSCGMLREKNMEEELASRVKWKKMEKDHWFFYIILTVNVTREWYIDEASL